MSLHHIVAIVVGVITIIHHGNGARILGIFPATSFSHQIVFRGLTLALNKRGHELVVVTPDPVNDPNLKNYTEIDCSFLYTNKNYDPNVINFRKPLTWIEIFLTWEPGLHIAVDEILGHPELEKIYAPNSNQTFDLMLLEALYWPAFLPLARRFDVPIVGITSLGLSINIQYMNGHPMFPSHPSNWELDRNVLGSLTFWQRMKNFFTAWKFLHYYRTVYVPKQVAIAKKHFGNDIPDLYDIEKNISLIFVNQQGPISYAKPSVPNVIEIGGLHVFKQMEPLEKDLQRVLDEATEGFLYMSLGTNVKSTMLSDDIRQEFIAAFSKLPYKVIWKFEDDVLPGKPENVIILKWAPQQAILAHPNLKAFVYQGGLQSTEEAIHHAVPMVGLPIWADQEMQINKLESLGVAKKLRMSAINRDDLLEAINTVTHDSSYKQRILKLRTVLQDRPYDPMENAVWWTEYVIRHKGAPHLRSTTADDPWYSRQDMDIIVLSTTVSLLFISLASVILYRLVHCICAFSSRLVGGKQKRL